MTGQIRWLAALTCLVASSLIGAARRADPLADLNRFIAKALTDYRVPGAAVGVVQDGKVVSPRGDRRSCGAAGISVATCRAATSSTSTTEPCPPPKFRTGFQRLQDHTRSITWNSRTSSKYPDFSSQFLLVHGLTYTT
jgi:hypothetical protein